jgi:hypothetical protein
MERQRETVMAYADRLPLVWVAEDVGEIGTRRSRVRGDLRSGRQARDKGEQASLSADKTKVEWDRSGCFPGEEVLTFACSDRRDTDAVVEGKGRCGGLPRPAWPAAVWAPSETCLPASHAISSQPDDARKLAN